MAVYLIKFDKPIGDTSRPRMMARYYVGYCEDGREVERLAEHKRGEGASLTAYASQQGIGFRMVAIYPGLDRNDERRIKKAGHFDKLDPELHGRRGFRWVHQKSEATAKKS